MADEGVIPYITALSPSGRHLAYAVEKSATESWDTESDVVVDPHLQHQQGQHQNGASEGDGGPTYHSSSMKYQVLITSRDAACTSQIPSAAILGVGQTSEQFPSSSSSSSPMPARETDVNTCLLKSRVTALQWLDESHLACGLQDGTVTIVVATRHRRSDSSEQQRKHGARQLLEHGLERETPWAPALSRCFHRVQHGGDAEDGARRVMRIRLSGGGAAGREGAASSVATRASEPTVWVLYPDRVVVCVGVEALVTLARQHMEHKAGSSSSSRATSTHAPPDPNDDPQGSTNQPKHPAGPSFAKIQLEGQDEVLDVVACSAPAGLFEVRPERHSHVILASGVSPALAFYPIGSESRSFGLASIAWAVASRVTSLTVGALDGLFGFVGLRGRGRKAAAAAAAAKEKAQRRGGVSGGGGDGEDASGGGGGGDDSSPAPLVLRWDGGLQDGWRRVSRLCLDPSGRLAAAADGFGRVMLVDCATRQILRMWKGVRDAECGWLEIVESWEGRRVASVGQNKSGRTAAAAVAPSGEAAATPVVGLYLAILAPLRGRVELWRMRHGPCVRVVPAPAGARLLTSRPNVVGLGEGAGGDAGARGQDAEALTSCYLLSGGAGGASGSETTKLRLSPLTVEEEDLADLPNRLSREPTVDDAYRLRKFAAALAEIRSQGAGPTSALSRGQLKAPGDRGRLPAGREAREDFLLQLLSQLESVESLAQATAALGGARLTVPPTVPSARGETSSKLDGKIELSASFQQRSSALCRQRAELVGGVTPPLEAEAAPADESKETAKAKAASSLSFRAAAFELYTVLQSVKFDPAREDEDEDPAFLPPGKRGWKHAALCEEAAGWANMAREAGGVRSVPSAELPEFEEFLETVSVVLEVEDAPGSRRASSAPGGRETSTPLLRFITLGSTDHGERKPAPTIGGTRSRRTSRDSASSIGSSSARQASRPLDGDAATAAATAAAAAAADHDNAAAFADRATKYARCRTRLVGWLFRPLLSDAFALASLTQALSLLGLGGGNRTAAVLVRDLAAWFLELPVGRAADTTVGREAQNCPVLRWLKGVILAWASSSLPPPSSSSSSKRSAFPGQDRGGDAGPAAGEAGGGGAAPHSGAGRRMADLFGDPVKGSGGSSASRGGVFADDDDDDHGDYGDDRDDDASSSTGDSEDDHQEDGREVTGGRGKGDGEKQMRADAEEILRPMFEACVASQRLENASMLSVVTAEALAACREKLEESSLGQVAIGGGEEWVTLARRVRVCLFMDHRIHSGVPPEQRDRASVRHFVEGKASVYSLVAKDQLMSFRDVSFAACSSRERAEVEASARSQRQTAEAKAAAAAAAAGGGGGGGGGRSMAEQRRRISAASALVTAEGVEHAVAAAPNLAAPQMDEHWSTVQAIAARAGDAPKMAALGAVSAALFDPPEEASANRPSKSGRERRTSPRGSSSGGTTITNTTAAGSAAGAAAAGPLPAGSFPETPPTTLFFMRSHAQPIILACHRTRWLVRSWASAGPASAEALQRATDPASLSGSVRAAEAAVRRLSLAVDHLSYLRTARPLLAGCVAYWLWEHGGVRAHVWRLARGGRADRGGGDKMDDGGSSIAGSGAAAPAALVEEGRPAREAFLTAAEEFLKVEALFPRPRDGADRGIRGGIGGGGGGPGASRGGGGAENLRSEVSFASLLTEGAMQRCPWPGAWDRWVEECLRDAQVHPPLQPAVAAHSTLLRALRVNTVCGLPEGETLGLFEKGHILCAEASLRNALLSSPAVTVSGEGRFAAAIAGGAGDGAERARHVVTRRESYIRRALDAVVPRPAQNVYRLARDFGVSEDTVRGWHCLVLLKRGHDVLGEEALSQIFSLQHLAGDILTVLRLRLKRFLDFLETSPRAWRGLLASLDADTCQWVRSARDPEAAARGGARSEKEAGEPLRSTHGVLLCLARALPGDSRHKRQANALVTLVGTMLQHLGRGGVGGAGYRR